MKAFFTVTEDSLSRRMGNFKLTFTLYIMCKFINGKGEEKNCQQSFTIFSIDVTGNASVFVFVCSVLHGVVGRKDKRTNNRTMLKKTMHLQIIRGQ